MPRPAHLASWDVSLVGAITVTDLLEVGGERALSDVLRGMEGPDGLTRDQKKVWPMTRADDARAASSSGGRAGRRVSCAGQWGMAESGAEVGPVGMRDRKKARTRALIREQALRLFAEQGFEATTVEQIAAAAEVSPSTFFRYFPAKENVLTDDGIDALVMAFSREQPPGLGQVAAVRAAVASALAALPAAERARFGASARLGWSLHQTGEIARTIEALAGAVGQRAGREHGDFTDRILAGALVGAVMAAALPGPDEQAPDLPARVDAALACLEGWPAVAR